MTLKVYIPGTGRQLGAAIVDGLGSFAAVAIALRGLLSATGIRPSVQGVVDALHADPMTVVPLALAIPVGVTLWHLLAVGLQGTPGQRLLGLRLVTRVGQAPGAARLILRGIVHGISVLACFAGPAWALLVDGRRRGAGDIVAGTVAVVAPKKPKATKAEEPRGGR